MGFLRSANDSIILKKICKRQKIKCFVQVLYRGKIHSINYWVDTRCNTVHRIHDEHVSLIDVNIPNTEREWFVTPAREKPSQKFRTVSDNFRQNLPDMDDVYFNENTNGYNPNW